MVDRSDQGPTIIGASTVSQTSSPSISHQFHVSVPAVRYVTPPCPMADRAAQGSTTMVASVASQGSSPPVIRQPVLLRVRVLVSRSPMVETSRVPRRYPAAPPRNFGGPSASVETVVTAAPDPSDGGGSALSDVFDGPGWLSNSV